MFLIFFLIICFQCFKKWFLHRKNWIYTWFRLICLCFQWRVLFHMSIGISFTDWWTYSYPFLCYQDEHASFLWLKNIIDHLNNTSFTKYIPSLGSPQLFLQEVGILLFNYFDFLWESYLLLHVLNSQTLHLFLWSGCLLRNLKNALPPRSQNFHLHLLDLMKGYISICFS